jgi:glycosyltransferase involved in cell wall biosynthesis
VKILVLSRWLPYPADNGSKIRILNTLRQLGQLHEVGLVTFGQPEEVADAGRLSGLGDYCSIVRVLPYRTFRPKSARALAGLISPRPRSLVDTFQPAMRDAIREETARSRYDVVLACQLDMVPYALGIPDVCAVLEELELTGYADARHCVGSRRRRWRAWLTWLKLAAYVRRSLPRFEACTVASEFERRTLRTIAPDFTNVHVIPNALDLTRYTETFGLPRADTLVYPGALTYAANQDAVAYFVGSIFPSIRRTIAEARLLVTGRTDGASITSRPQAPGVEYTGYLADVRPTVAESWLSIAPLRRGGGTRVKVLESMALGTPVVATSKGAEGLEVTHGLDILIADDPGEFARRVCDLLRSADLRARLAANGRRLVEAKYDARVVGQRLLALLEQTVGTRACA